MAVSVKLIFIKPIETLEAAGQDFTPLTLTRPLLFLQTQEASLHLAGRGHGQLVYELDFFGVFVRGQQAADVTLQFLNERSFKLLNIPR
jgi:hypothetical protein